ncbi:MAG: hypothetical protein ACREO9_07635, partial [Lysobacterales bacterium]
PSPVLGEVSECPSTTPSTSAEVSSLRLMQAGLLMALGLPPAATSDALQLPPEVVKLKHESFTLKVDEVGIRFAKKDHLPLTASTWASDENLVIRTLHAYARWLSINKSMVVQLAIPLLPSFHWSGSRLVLKNEAQLTALLPLLKSLRTAGFRVVFRPGHECLLPAGIRSGVEAASVEIHKVNGTEQVYGTVAFLMEMQPQQVKKLGAAKPKLHSLASAGSGVRPESASPRSYGRAGRLAVAGLLLCLSA